MVRTLFWYSAVCVVLTLFRVREFVCVTSRTRACAHSLPDTTQFHRVVGRGGGGTCLRQGYTCVAWSLSSHSDTLPLRVRV